MASDMAHVAASPWHAASMHCYLSMIFYSLPCASVAGLPIHAFHQLPWASMALATMTLHDTVIELLRTFMTLPSPCHGIDMALPWARHGLGGLAICFHDHPKSAMTLPWAFHGPSWQLSWIHGNCYGAVAEPWRSIGYSQECRRTTMAAPSQCRGRSHGNNPM